MKQKTTFLAFKRLPFFAVFLFLSLLSLKASAQTTEAFEDDAVGGTTFSDNGQHFTIVNGPGEISYDIETYFGAGWNGTAADNNFIDNSNGTPGTNDGSSFSIKTTDGTDIIIKSFYLFLSNRYPLGTPSTTLTITGKKNGAATALYTITKSSGFSNPATFSPNNGYTFINFATEGGTDYSNVGIDEIIISTTGNADYLALDGLTWAVAPVDAIAPRITSIIRQTPTTSPTNADALVWDVTFDEPVNNVDVTDFAVLGTTATIASVTNPSGNVYRVTVSGGDLAALDATVTLGHSGGQNITDASGNALTNLIPTGTNDNTFVVDNTEPLISSIARQSPTTSPTNADALAWDVTFDGPVSNVDATDFTVSGTTATVASVTNPSGNVYRVTVSGGDLAALNATVTLDFAGGQDIADAVGNTLTDLTPTGTNDNTFVLDNTEPLISSIARQSPTTSPTDADALVWDVTFDGPVSNVDATDFTVSGTTATVASVTNPSGNVYRVTVSGGDLAALNATVTLDFAGGQDIADAVGNALTNLTPTGTNDNTFVLDNEAPVDPIVTSPSATTTTNSTTLTISGTHAENGITVNAYIDANNDGIADNTTSLGSATVTGNTWSFTVNLTAESANNFVVIAKDAISLTSNNVDVPTVTQTNTATWIGVTNTDWSEPSNWSTNAVPPANADIIIPSSLNNYPTASNAVTFNSLTINSGASFIPQSTVTGPVTFKRNIPTTNWYLASTPIANETLQNIMANNTFASGTGVNIGIGSYSNDGATPWFYANTASTGNFIPGLGVSIKLDTPNDLSSTGNLNTSNVMFPVSASGSRNKFNLIGNPYTAYVNSGDFANVNTDKLTEKTVWLWNGTSYTTYNATSPIEIAPGQGFFIEASTDGAILFSTTNRSHQNTDTFMRQTPKTSFELFIENNDTKKSTKVFYIEGKTTDFDNGYDSKMFNGVSSSFEVFTQLVSNNQGKNLAIQTLPDTNYNSMVVPVGVKATAGKEITFSLNTSNFNDDLKIFLEDRLTNTFTRLNETNSTYKVTLSKNLDGIGRFYIHTTNSTLSIDGTATLENTSIYKLDNTTLRIAGLPQGNANIKLYSMLGKQVVKTAFTSNGTKDIALPVLAKGVYLVKLETGKGKLNKKIILE
ncbi:T9SS type A sorting domain-containing protein [Polaribacter staleyi]|uniref:beta strand repeat-containing protein n=1 Tax=Polaribacter staleyi TaxID=2022337 RepID=UPI0031BAD6C5